MLAHRKILNSFVSVLFLWIILHIIKLAKSMICVMAIDLDAVFQSLPAIKVKVK
jgi:hypothetical protein